MKRLPSSLHLATYMSTGIVLALILASALVAQTTALGELTPDHLHVVTSDGDENDNNLSDGMCRTSKGECTLRAAIQQANETANVDPDTPDQINFNIEGDGQDVHTLLPLSPLPTITEAVYIDGYSQGIFAANTLEVGSDAELHIEIDGTFAGAFTFGLTLTSSGSTIRGLVINRFKQAGIWLEGANENHIEGNFIGTDATGTSARPNRADGIVLFNSSSNIIGGATPDKRNVISGNAWSGVAILNGPSQRNIVEGNYIGTDPSGLNDVGNGEDGVLISAVVGVSTYASMNRIGGVEPGQGNLISGNGWSGVEIVRGTQNEILGNLIGTTADGTTRLKNNGDGVLLFEASNNLVGGQFASDGSGEIEFFKRNVISGNGFCGVDIFVRNQPADGNLVVGNLIGTDISGLGPLPNSACGVFLGSAVGATAEVVNNIIGGTDGPHAKRNIISGNGGSGVLLIGPMVTNNGVVGNYIGLDKTGTAKLGNDLDGVRFTTFAGQTTGPIGNFIGTSSANGGNVISGNGRDGVAIAFGSTGNFVQNNIIGLGALGTGTDPAETAELGNTRHGVAILDSPGNFIGRETVESRNVISGNGGSGVHITGANATGNELFRNLIGVASDGSTDSGNRRHGVFIGDGASNNTIGDVTNEKGNVIAFNALSGVAVESGTGNAIRGNAIFDNGGLGIDLGGDGLTENDSGDGDPGPNNLQNFPILLVKFEGGNTVVDLQLNMAGSTTFHFDVYANETGDGISAGQGRTYLTTETATTPSSGMRFVENILIPGEYSNITVTATDEDGNRS